LTLYPHGSYHFGLGLYEKLSVLSWALECILCIVLASAADQVNRKRCAQTSSLLLVVHIYEMHGSDN
jgi:hypothetical protein